jgi:hypothetical protein
MEGEVCRSCGGDGRIGNALGGTSATCPSCHGSGRRAEDEPRYRDVTKTKPSHYRPAPQAPAGPKVPVTAEGAALAREVNECTVLGVDAKARLVAEIMNHESTHGRCTKTFIKKVRKQARPGGGA